MRGKRERLFECRFTAGAEDVRVVFRAWTPAEAAHDFEEALRRSGVQEAGEITVRDLRGGPEVRLAIGPAPRASSAGAA